MALKENIEALKQELSAQEQLLENIIAGERFFKKHKKKIIVILALLIVLLIGYVSAKTIRSSNLKASNEAYKVLLSSPQDEQALSTLRSKNKPLYRAFVFKEASKSGDKETLKKLLSENNKDVIAALAAYELQESISGDNILENFVVLKEGYELLKDGKAEEANLKFATIASDSVVMDVIRKLEHYQPTKKEERR